MTTLEWIIGLLLGAVVLSALARKVKVPYPTFLAIAGVMLAFVPAVPSWTLDPELTLALFVAPVLLDAGYDTSLRDLRNNWLPVSTLVVIAVAVTTIAVAIVARRLVPDMPWSAAAALGAIVAPPDAAAAVAILRQVKLPYRLLKVLEGESLLNDASALLIYRTAVGAAAMTHLAWREIAPSVALSLAGSPIAGYVAAKIWLRLTPRVNDAPTAIILQFAGTFTIWIAAERLGLSAILTTVVYAVTLARTAPARTPARLRVPSYAVWETAVFMLNVLAFMLIGMQLRPIWIQLDDTVRLHYAEVAGCVLAVIIVVRILWVAVYGLIMRLLTAKGLLRQSLATGGPTLKGGIVVGWCGMRGIVTLASAFALPEGFPYRELILLTACSAVLGTLVLQGLTLRPLILMLRLQDDSPVALEVARARGVAFRAALEEIDGDPSEAADLLRQEYRELLMQADGSPDGGIAATELPADPLRRRAIRAARNAILGLRNSEEIGDDAFHQIEEELDRAELSAEG
ncbi:Na+/H+ antiporter [Bradyrhizobium sp. STM 3843]|uniref:cation:proton antiporter n=1 Tax=Bradyrhizobium sp. STM 3843 TaxID=551947 RepID=UPI0002404663|nr:sodium:proton antiporter [Bradyrhizobium sp. STM 3843]CCE08634.1 Na+/H+ antiporter [Bradyrhizobium sp. STM 3843]